MSKLLTSYSPEIVVTVLDRDWRLSRARDLDSLWEEMTADGRATADEHIPYWTELWPASLVLCQWLGMRREDIRGRVCVDMGCGIGLTALVGQWLGARVVAMDYEFEALRHALRNAGQNGVAAPLFVAMDWARPALAGSCADFVWGGDIMYERRFVGPVLEFCARVLKKGGKAWVAEPGRTVYDAFLQALPDFGWSGRKVFGCVTKGIYAQNEPNTVTIWELVRS